MQLQYNGMPLLLPQWFIQCHNATLNKVSYLVNFPTYIRNTSTNNFNELLNEINQRKFTFIKLTFTLYVTPSVQFQMPSLSLLNKIVVVVGVLLWCWCVKSVKNTLWKRLLFSWLHFDDTWNIFAKICTVWIGNM